MKSLTVCQPYASLISSGLKKCENRTWHTSYRGLLYIHAGKSRAYLTEEPPATMPFGAVIAIANLVDCLPHDRIVRGHFDAKYPWLQEHEHAHGPWCWILESVSPIGPWPWPGKLGLFEIDENELGRAANLELGISEPLRGIG